MKRFMYGVHRLLHISVFLFFCGISNYLHIVYLKVGMISWYCVITVSVAYLALSALPLIISNCLKPQEDSLRTGRSKKAMEAIHKRRHKKPKELKRSHTPQTDRT